MAMHYYDENPAVEEVMKLGANYFAGLIYKVESRKIQVFDITKSITNQFEYNGSVTPKQAEVLLKFKKRFDPSYKPLV